jgi:DNA-binding SARP family transcriptional activator
VLRTLGGLELTASAPGDALDELLARPKPLGVLVYLALADAAPVQRRDTLLGVFWPDADAARARSSLRQALYQLRRGLGAHAMVGRGDEIGIVPGSITCDAVQFMDCIRRGDRAGALDLYRGDLLPGFFVEGAPAFDAWLDARRRQLRDTASAAARHLAGAAESTGDSAAALSWWRRAVEIARADEPSVRRLMTLLSDSGERAAALREYDSFAQHLREEYDLEPAAETRSLAHGLRAGGTARAAAEPDPRRVLVTVFENRTGVASLDALGSLIADSIAQGVARLDDVQVLPLTAALSIARDVAAAGTSSAERMQQLALETGAGTVVSGACYVAGDELVVQGWIADVRTGDVGASLGPARAPASNPLAAVHALRDEACTILALRLETRVSHVRAAGRAPSYEAHTAHIEGIVRFVAGDWQGALPHFERAAAGDATYALPLIVSAITRWNLGQLAEARSALDRAAPLLGGTGPFERALHDMVRAWLAGDWDAASTAVRRQAELAPGSIPGFQVAEEARRRNRPHEAVRVLLQLDPLRGELRGWIFYWVVLAEAYHMLGDHARELDAAQRARALYPESALALRMELHARAALGDIDGLHACIHESLASPSRREPRAGTLLREAAHELRAHGHDDDTAAALLAQAAAWHHDLSADERSSAAVQRATARALYESGDLPAASALFTELAGDAVRVTDACAVHHPHLGAHLDHGYLGVIAVRCGDDAEAARIEALLAGAHGGDLFGSTFYWRAAMAALRGDGAGAARLLRRAFAHGMPYDLGIHRDPHFHHVRSVAEFAAVLAPRTTR